MCDLKKEESSLYERCLICPNHHTVAEVVCAASERAMLGGGWVRDELMRVEPDDRDVNGIEP